MAGQRFNSGRVSDWGRDSNLPNFFRDSSSATMRIPYGNWIGQATQATQNNGRLFGFWFWLNNPFRITEIITSITTAATDVGQLCRVGIYQELTPSAISTDVNMALVVDGGTISVTTQGQKTATLGTPTVLQAGVWYFGVIQSETTKTNQPTFGAFYHVGAGFYSQSIGVISNNFRSSNSNIQPAIDTSSQVAGGLESTKSFVRTSAGANQAFGGSIGVFTFGGDWA